MESIFIILIIFGSITAWVWMGIHAGSSKGNNQKVEQLEQDVQRLTGEVEQMRDLVSELMLESNERPFRQFDDQLEAASRSVDAG